MSRRALRRFVELDPKDAAPAALYRFLTGAVAPRPVAWITTLGADGTVNAAPFSWYNSVCADPPMVMAAIAWHPDGRPKDTLRNILASKEFVVNVVPRRLLERMVATSADYPPDVSEAEALGLATAPSRKVRPPRLADSPIHLECRLEREVRLGHKADTSLVLGEVVHIGADDSVLDARGNPDPGKLTLVARMGASWYTDTDPHIDVPRPRVDDPVRRP